MIEKLDGDKVDAVVFRFLSECVFRQNSQSVFLANNVENIIAVVGG